MLKHIVMFKVKENAEGKSKEELLRTAEEMLKNFETEIPTLLNFKAVTNMPGTPEVNCDIALICEFENIEGMEAYKVHPKHVAFSQFITQIRESRACIDYEI